MRKDRFKSGMRDIAAIVSGCGHDYEIADVVKAMGVRLAAALDMTCDVFESELKALEAIDYLRAVLDNPKESK